MKLIVSQVCTFVVSFFVVTVVAADFDGSEPLMCSLGQVLECDAGLACRAVTNESVDAPDFIKLDFRKKQIVATTAGEDSPPDNIDNVIDLSNELVVQGVQGTYDGNALGWSMAISHETGRMVMTGAGEDAGFVVFGACSPM